MAEPIADVEIKVRFSHNEVISAIQELGPEEREHFIENLLAATSPEYLDSVREARADHRAGRVSTHQQVFGKVQQSDISPWRVPNKPQSGGFGE